MRPEPRPVVHLVVGPAEHGVVRHGVQIANACGHEHLATPRPELGPTVRRVVALADAVHVPFTDRLFGPDAEQAADAFERLAGAVRAHGAALSVTLHDVPDPAEGTAWALRRTAAYARVVAAAADGVVVNSGIDLGAVQDAVAAAPRVRSLRRIDLAVDPVPGMRNALPAEPGCDVTVLGFVFPDRGYEQVLDALPAGSGLLALGRPSDGHEDLPAQLADRAARRGRSWRLTGFVPDPELADALRAAAVPVAPNRRVTSSGSVLTWLAHGRRPIVPRTAYTAELAARMPGALTLYDPELTGGPDSLACAIELALRDPRSTWLAGDVRIGPPVADVARAYEEHFDACRPPQALRIGTREVLPGNRWDLLARATPAAPLVSVVVPYHRAQADLDRVLTALQVQTIADRIEVVVADDGSPEPPDVSAAGSLPVRIVRQPRDGFGASRARHLGATQARGEILAFLDGDTVPEPQYLEQLTRLPAADPDVLTVGRRRHAELDGWDAERLRGWLVDGGTSPEVLTEPEWLRGAYARSHDLLDADARSYRFVISAVLCLSRELYERAGGFDPRFTAYGGEDWELANRAWHAGALFAHVPHAVAWHNGADWAGRDDGDGGAIAAKNVETLTLARLLPDPAARGRGQWARYPRTIVLLAEDDPVRALATVRTAFAAGSDCGVWLTGPQGKDVAGAIDDPRVHAGVPPEDVLARAAVVVAARTACDLSELEIVAQLAVDRGMVRTPALDAVATRALGRCRLGLGAPADGAPFDEDALARVATLFGSLDRATPVPFAGVDLAAVLGRLRPTLG